MIVNNIGFNTQLYTKKIASASGAEAEQAVVYTDAKGNEYKSGDQVPFGTECEIEASVVNKPTPIFISFTKANGEQEQALLLSFTRGKLKYIDQRRRSVQEIQGVNLEPVFTDGSAIDRKDKRWMIAKLNRLSIDKGSSKLSAYMKKHSLGAYKKN